MNVLILGSEGFIGSHCIKFFSQKGFNVCGVDILDLKNSVYPYYRVSRMVPGFDEIFITQKFDICINAAGSGSVPFSLTHPFADFEANTIDTLKLLESIRLLNPDCKYVNISSAAVYGNPEILPITEDSAVKPLSPYGWHKFYSELICKEYNTLYNIPTCSIRPFSVYGPGLKKQLFWDIFQKTQKSKEVTLFGTGQETRDFIYISDLVESISLLAEKAPMKGEVYNVGSGIETKIKDAATIFLKLIDIQLILNFNGITKSGDPLNWRADVEKISKLGFNFNKDLKGGLLSYATWILDKNYK